MNTIFDLNDYKAPFVNSSFYELLKINKKDEKFTKYSDEINKFGYTIVDLKINDEAIDTINKDIDRLINSTEFKRNSNFYHYNKSPRIVEGWKHSDGIKKIINNKFLNDLLTYCYQSKPIPFSTINFLKGTEQPLHSDEIHFGSLPHGYLTGCWIALEDIHPDSGPLAVAEQSHDLPLFSFEDMNMSIPKSEIELKEYYTIYEEWVRNIIKSKNLKIKELPIKKGQCIIWSSNLLHGAYKIKNPSLTRKSLVIHFHYDRCEKVYYPSYSNVEKGRYMFRNIENINDVI